MSSGDKRGHPPDSGHDSGPSKRSRAPDRSPPDHGYSRDQYTIGWVCALPLEMAAAKGMLDKIHPNPTEQDPNDHNTYLLGEVFGHNVVVACLPAGIYGIAPAATVAKDMLRTFKSIRFGLMVGIGGGIPSKTHDIRLGDVVVGQPTATNGGVVQYDRGKALQGHGFERTGTLNTPPQILLAALSRLQADHLVEDTRVTEFLEHLPGKMRKRFGHPGVCNDWLFRSEYSHIDDNATCEQCDRSQAVDRGDRDTTEPVIHYGTIASGDQIIKDATLRDQLGGEIAAICFETEAAGLRDFPSLVIRGICDYADSHKNKMWQFYAASVAAAFAKELLSLIPPSRVLQDDPITRLVSIAAENLIVSKQHLNVSSQTLSEQRRTNQILEDRAIDLHIVHEACYNSADVGGSPRCEKGTRVRIQQAIQQWADDDTGESFLWLIGPAGTGKPTLIRSLADSFHQDNRLVAGYFFKRGDQGRNDTNRLFSTLAMQLADNISSFKKALRVSISDIDGYSMEEKDLIYQFEKLLKNPLQGLDFDEDGVTRIIVLDAPDECERPENLPKVLALISEICDTCTALRLRVLLASRPEAQVARALEPLIQNGKARQLERHREFPEDTKADVRLYLENNFTRIRTQNKIQQSPWPSVEDVDHLVELSTSPEPLFIYAATLVRFIYDEKRLQNPKNQLKKWINQCKENRSQLHQMYNPILEQIFAFAKDTDFDQQLVFLGALVLVNTPLSLHALSSLLGLDVDDVSWWLPGLHAVLDIPSEPSNPIRLRHKSFGDFLLGPGNPSHAHFQLKASEIHILLARRCIEIMALYLKQDICDYKKLDLSREDIGIEEVNRCILPEVRYSCTHWIYHLRAGGSASGEQILSFLLKHFLHWLEVLALLQRTSDGLEDLHELGCLIKTSSNISKKLVEFLNDATRVLSSFASIIESAPLQTYASLLLFSPISSLIRQQFWDQRLPPHSHIEGVKYNWDAHVQTFQADSYLKGLAFSPDGKFLASAGNTVRLWNASTGGHLMTYKAASDASYVTFSSSNELLAAVCGQSLVRVWVIDTWEQLNTIRSRAIHTIAFSTDKDVLAVVESDNTVHFWNVRSGVLQKTMNFPTSWVLSDGRAFPVPGISGIPISPNFQLFASTSQGNRIELWGLAPSATMPHILNPDNSPVSTIAFSPDGKLLAAAGKSSIFIWDTETHRRNYTMENSDISVALAFSPQSRLLASTSENGVRLWTMATGAYVDLLDRTRAVAFSPDGELLATASDEKNIKVWDLKYVDAQYGQSSSKIQGLPSSILLFSPNGKLVVSQPELDTLQIWNSMTGKLLRALKHENNVDDIQFSSDSKLLACRCGPHGHWIWEVGDETKEPTRHSRESQTRTLKHPVVYSESGHLAAVQWDSQALDLYDATTGYYLSTLQSHVKDIHGVTFSPDGNLLAFWSSDDTIQLWDTKTRTRQFMIKMPEDSCFGTLKFSPGGTILAYGDLYRINWWDTAFGVYQHTFDRIYGAYHSHAFSPNKLILAAAVSKPRTREIINLYDVTTGHHRYTLHGHLGRAIDIAFSPDSLMVAVASEDRRNDEILS
ncbi:hypothetical protein NW768_004888 [Fusarium equiseti]|uniref:Nephrocystin 3-like N-terminal domain-containing protein n=1 Tax=Fusarium equiseti TaxID=61235 RepID=A0ABQ8RHE9_FUSEQ|nr:hypothetical protein NW768_004888 [Fusarium equiseti]